MATDTDQSAGSPREQVGPSPPACYTSRVRIFAFVAFFSAVLVLDALIHRYFYIRLIRDPGWSPRVKVMGAVLFTGLAVFLPGGMLVARLLPKAYSAPVAAAAFVWMGTILYLFLILAIVDLTRAVLDPNGRLRRLLATDRQPAPVDPSRRTMIARSTAQVATVMSGGIAVAAVRSGLAEVEVKEVQVKVPRLPPQLSGLTVVQMSDIHVGALIGKGFINAIVEKANAQKPDIICITGDLVDGTVAMLEADVAPLAKLKARYGTFFVTGNHEYYSGAQAWIRHLGKLGIQVMRNSAMTIGDTAKLDIAGVDDHSAGRFFPDHGVFPDLVARGRDPDRPMILMAHQPRSIDLVQDLKPDLVLSGHTHGGQLWPFAGVVRLVQPYIAGLYQHNAHTQIYVSSGTGYWGPPMRLLAPSEITKLVLS